MKGTSIDFLRNKCKNETNAKAKIRLKTAILRKQERTYSEICSSLDVLPSTLSYWLNRLDQEGVNASHHRTHPGRISFLNESQLMNLQNELMQDPQKFGFTQSMWSTKMVIKHVKKRYGFKYATRSMYDLLHRIGFSIKRPRITHYNSATKVEKKEFKKKQNHLSRDIQKKDIQRSVWMRQRT